MCLRFYSGPGGGGHFLMSEALLEVVVLKQPSCKWKKGTAGRGPWHGVDEGGRDVVHGYLARKKAFHPRILHAQ